MSATAQIPPKDASSPGVMLPNPAISIAAQEITIPTSAYVVKSTRQLRMIVAKYDKAAGDFLRQFRHKLVRVSVPHMGIVFTAAVNERKSDHALFVRIPSNLKRFFMPLWQSGAMFLVLITIDAKLLQLDQETRNPTNLKDGLKQVRSQVGDAPAHQGGINRGAPAPSGGQVPIKPGRGG